MHMPANRQPSFVLELQEHMRQHVSRDALHNVFENLAAVRCDYAPAVRLLVLTCVYQRGFVNIHTDRNTESIQIVSLARPRHLGALDARVHIVQIATAGQLNPKDGVPTSDRNLVNLDAAVGAYVANRIRALEHVVNGLFQDVPELDDLLVRLAEHVYDDLSLFQRHYDAIAFCVFSEGRSAHAIDTAQHARLGLLPVLPSSGGFEGDLILLLALLELPSMCIIAAGFSSRSIFGEIGSAREAVLSVAYNVVFLLAIVSIAASQHTFRLEALAALPASPLRWLGIAALLVCLPAKLHLNPFSLPNAEQEIYSGPMVEYAGPELAMWELSHGLEWVAATGLVATLAAPYIAIWWLAAIVFVALSFAIVLLLSALASATARLAIDTTVRFYWQCTLIFAVLAISSALFMRFRS